MSSSNFRFRLAIFGIAALLIPLCLPGQTNQFEKSFHQGTEAMRAGQWDEAAKAFGEATVIMPTSAKAYFNRAVAYEGVDDEKSAYLDYQQALALKPDWEAPKHELQRFTVTRRQRSSRCRHFVSTPDYSLA